MATDLFNNPSNDYVNPGLSPCAGAGDDSYFQIGDGAAEIISGSDILAKMDLSDIKIGVSAYSIQNQILSEGEVVYIPGLTKGLQNRVLGFNIPDFSSHDEDLNKYFYQIDLSINYYKNFRYYYIDIDVSANYSQNIDIESALNIAFGNAGIGVTASYDPSLLKFTGNVDGFDFSIPNIEITTILSSDPSVFETATTLQMEENSDAEVPYAKYPNGASQGIVLKGIYPTTTPSTPYDKWLYINHVTDPVVTYEAISVNQYDREIVRDFDPSISFGPFVGYDSSIGFQDVTLQSISFVDQYANHSLIYDCSVNDSSIYDSSVYYSSFGGSALEKVRTNIFSIDASERSQMTSCTINDSAIWNASITDSSIYDSFLYDVSLINCTLYNCTYTDPNIIDDPIVTFENCIEILVDASIGIAEYLLDSSTYYKKLTRRLDVGCTTASTSSILNAGDYLDWVNTNDYWYKFGDLYMWTSAPDGCSACHNLIDGFYVYNPHTFDVKIEYMLFI